MLGTKNQLILHETHRSRNAPGFRQPMYAKFTQTQMLTDLQYSEANNVWRSAALHLRHRLLQQHRLRHWRGTALTGEKQRR